jgi:hypothetical protein
LTKPIDGGSFPLLMAGFVAFLLPALTRQTGVYGPLNILVAPPAYG